jgi:protein-disulfide isomerase
MTSSFGPGRAQTRPSWAIGRALGALVLLAAALAPASAAAAEALSAEEKAAVEALIERYILDHPDVILESVRAFVERQESVARGEAQANLSRLKQAIQYDPETPVAGNPDGDVTVVEFFDYRCRFCKASLEMVMSLLRDDPNVRVVFKEFPILSPESVRAAQAALAAERQGKYLEFHYALMSARGSYDDQQIFDIAAEVGLDIDRLAKDMEAPEIQAMIDTNLALAQALNIDGTPTFLIEERMLRGAIDPSVLHQAIAQERAVTE